MQNGFEFFFRFLSLGSTGRVVGFKFYNFFFIVFDRFYVLVRLGFDGFVNF